MRSCLHARRFPPPHVVSYDWLTQLLDYKATKYPAFGGTGYEGRGKVPVEEELGQTEESSASRLIQKSTPRVL